MATLSNARDEDLGGLSSVVAAERLRSDGPNALPIVRPLPAWRQIASQLSHFFAILLWIAGGLAIVAGMAELGIAIFLVVVVNALFAFGQEHRAERAGQKLQSLLPRRSVVERDGVWLEVDAGELVVGDLVMLSAGDLISADVRVVRGRGLSVDQSTLTGESVPVFVVENEAAFAGTFVVEGEARARVAATGKNTRLAGIAELTQSRQRPRTPLARELSRLVRVIAVVAVTIGVSFFLVGWLVGLAPRDGFLFAIGVAVALVPEGLLPTVTLSLAMGASRMANRGALVRRLEAIETLGSTTFICSDKTGTLTCNEMNAVEVWTPAGGARVQGRGYGPSAEIQIADPSARSSVERLALAAARCSSGRALLRGGEWVPRGDPMEAALHALALRLGVDLAADERRRPESARFPFDPHRRLMSTVVSNSIYTKGAPDSVFAACEENASARQFAAEMAGRGLRVIAIATRRVEAGAVPERAQEAEANLELLGLVGLFDPPRLEVRSALEACRRAGMRVAMVTGDHPGTAAAIAREVGLRQDLVITGDELPKDDALLGALLDRDGVVACRVSPEQKLQIARALQGRGHVVAMTGDGVNDGPALHQADIGIAMGRTGTDVARAAADLVLLDDRFETIVHAIEEGRGTFANIRRFLTYHLTDNVAELTPFAIWALSGGRFPLALGVLQILCLDLLTDQLPALALGSEPPGRHLLDQAPHARHIVDARLLARAFLFLGAIESLFELGAFIAVLQSFGWRPGAVAPTGRALLIASGAAFVAVVAGQAATALACRSTTRAGYRVSFRSNPRIFAALAATWLITACLLYTPWLARQLGQAPPSAAGLVVGLLAFPAVLFADAAAKHLMRFRRVRCDAQNLREAPKDLHCVT